MTKPWTFDRNTIGLRVDYGHTFGQRSVERSLTLGGFSAISGYTQNSLVAPDYLTGQLIGFRRFSEVQNPLFNLSFFLGNTLELTNVNNQNPNFEDDSLITSGSVFLGGDTPLLPVYVDFGLADTGERSVYIVLGRTGVGSRGR